jgi:hypothetical protein
MSLTFSFFWDWSTFRLCKYNKLDLLYTSKVLTGDDKHRTRFLFKSSFAGVDVERQSPPLSITSEPSHGILHG